MNTSLRILVPLGWSNEEKGSFFEDLVARVFQKMQYRTITRVRVTGMEIDILAQDIHTHENAYVECKFYSEPFSAAIISKLIGNAISEEKVSRAYLISTSEPGKEAKGKLLQLEEQSNLIRGVLRFGYIGPTEFATTYLEVNALAPIETRLTNLSRTSGSISSATLVITPADVCWVLEEQQSGVPTKAFVLPVDPLLTRLRDPDGFRRLIDDNKVWPGLVLLDDYAQFNIHSGVLAKPNRDLITQVPISDRFDDYGPARPEDFVGRTDLQRTVFRFLERVRDGKSTRRVLALYGPSGFGKSSVVLKLANKTQSSLYRNRFYLYHIDSRSAASPLFVMEALRVALQQGISDGFIGLPGLSIAIDSIENPLSSSSIQACLASLKNSDRVFVIFFDQFEELLTKENLLMVFDVLRKLAFEVEAIQSNLVLGFSWRTGLSFGEDHPAYHMWHSLQDKRHELKIGLFNSTESSELVTTLEKYLGKKLDAPLRRNILEQAQGYPWLLKKLCVHVFRQLQRGMSHRALVEAQLNAAILFDEDTRDLTPTQVKCLKYIAENSPVDLADLQGAFGPDAIEFLYHSRLIIKSGYKYSVYWDIFREFLVDGEVPNIPVTYIPQSQLATSLSVLSHIIKDGPLSVEEIEAAFTYTLKTVWNIVADLSAFFLIRRDNDDRLQVIDEIDQISDFERHVASYLSKQLQRHVVMQILNDSIPQRGNIPISEFELLVGEAYPATSPNSLHSYMNRILSWLRFAGLIELEDPDLVVRPISNGRDMGKVIIRHPKLIDGKAIFLGISSPKRTVDLAVYLCRNKRISRRDILNTQSRNAAQDLTALSLATWKGQLLSPGGELAELVDSTGQDIAGKCLSIIRRAALESKFLKLLAREKDSTMNKSDTEIMYLLASTLGRDWQESSATRYFNGGIRWLEYFGELRRLQGQLSLDELLFTDSNLE
jgi:hypothetical protein